MPCRSTRIFLVAFLCLFNTIPHWAQVTFVIEQLPSATPADDTIFLSGSFNNWKLHDSRYILQKRLDGKLAVRIPQGIGTFQYKFHRGSWAKVETSRKNEYIPNREFTFGDAPTVAVVIENWQDVGGARQFDYFALYFFACAILAMITAYLISQMKSKRPKFAMASQAFIFFIGAVLLGRVVYEFSSLKWQSYFDLASDVLLFAFGPLWYLMVKPDKIGSRSFPYHFLPATLILFIIALKIINFGWLQFLTMNAGTLVLSWNSVLFFGLALVSNCTYVVLGIITAMKGNGRVEAERIFISHLGVMAIFFLMILFAKLIGLLLQAERLVSFIDRDVIFIFSTFFIWLITYHVFRNEEVFRTTGSPVRSEDLEMLKNSIHRLMKEKKSFKNPHLTLTEFAEMVSIKPHLLSKVINECYRQNFRDFVNKYRVEEFIELARQDSSRRFTFLALANEVGFNSKSTFNAAFKKVTHRSPREFFKSHKMLAD